MEQQPPPPMAGQGPDCHVMDIELQPVDAAAIHVKPHLPGGSADRHVVVDVASGGSAAGSPRRSTAGDDDDDGENCCLVCTEPMAWVVVGRCGHRLVCSKCMVRIRFFHRNRRCCVCRTRCPKLVVTKRDGAGDRDTAILSTLPLFALREGRVGRYWYHRHTAAYFEDEQEYNAVRAACHGILSPYSLPKKK